MTVLAANSNVWLYRHWFHLTTLGILGHYGIQRHHALRFSLDGTGKMQGVTSTQARALGAWVRSGEHGTGIVFFKMLERDGDTSHQSANDEPARRVIPLLRSFTVFNAAKVDGLPEGLAALPEPDAAWSPVATAEELLARSGAVIRHGGDRACYRPGDDVIQLPLPGVFPEATLGLGKV